MWGAQGGNSLSTVYADDATRIGGKGGYSKGTVTLERGEVLYIHVGGQGTSSLTKTELGKNPIINAGGYNGGGTAYTGSYVESQTSTSITGYLHYCAGGGGATDIRIGQNSLYARIIVAGGGSGAWGKTNGYAGGGETSDGYNSTYKATQTKAGKRGGFGEGGSQTQVQYNIGVSAGGGGGWYGGGSDWGSNSGYNSSTAGGSGYVYTSSSAVNYPSGCLLNSSYYMTNTSNICGTSSFPSVSGENETGHSGNGYARISYTQILDETPPTVTFSVNGSSTYVANATTIVNIEDISGVETLKYQWTDSSTAPSESTFTLAFTSGETLTLSSENGQWYLWIYASDTLGNSTIVGSNAFLLDSLSPTGTISILPIKAKNGKKYANTNLVTVNLTVADNVTSEADMKVALVNEEEFDSKEANTPIEWSTFSRTKTWNLSDGEGRKRVYVIFKDKAGNQSLYMVRDMNNI